jgi:hypothetical protein
MATRTGKSFNLEPSGKNVSKINYSWTTEPFEKKLRWPSIKIATLIVPVGYPRWPPAQVLD